MNEQTSHRSSLDRFFDQLRATGIRRDQGRYIAGVSGAVARRLGVDPVLVRIGLIVATVFFGIGVFLYLVVWLLTPDGQDRLPVEGALREGDTKSVLLLVLVVLALFSNAPWFWNDGGWFGLTGLVWTVATVALVIWLVRRSGGAGTAPVPPRPGGAAEPPPPPGAPHSWSAPGATAAPAATAAQGATAAPGSPTPPTAPLGQAAPRDPAVPVSQTVPLGQTAPEPPVTATPDPAPFPPHPAPADDATLLLPSGQRASYTGWVADPVRYPAPRSRRGPGGLVVLGTTGLMTLVAGGILLADQHARWSFPGLPLAAAGALAVVAVVTIVLGVRGRRSGFLSVLAALTLVATLAMSAAPRAVWVDGPAGRVSWTVTASDLTAERTMSLGQGRLDLTALDPRDQGNIRVRAGAGEVLIIVPRDVTVRVRATVSGGSILETVTAADIAQGAPSTASRSSNDNYFVIATGTRPRADRTYGAGPATVTVDVELGVGDVRVDKER